MSEQEKMSHEEVALNYFDHALSLDPSDGRVSGELLAAQVAATLALTKEIRQFRELYGNSYS